MAQSILSMAIDVCDRNTVKAPTTLFDTNDKIARILRMAANDTVRDIMRSAMRNGLSGYKAQWVFSTKPGVYSYKLPPDFYRVIPGTEQRDRWPLGILGPVNPQTWSNWVSGLGYSAVPMGWRIANDLIHLEPIPTQTEAVVIEYMSRYVVMRAATDADLAPVDGRLEPIAPLVPRDGYLGTGALSAVQSGGSAWGTALWGTGVWGSTPEQEMRRIPAEVPATKHPEYQVRAERFTSDDDTSAMDDSHVLSLGMTWRLLKGMRKPYAEEKNEYEDEKDRFLGDDASQGRTIVFGELRTRHEIEALGSGNWMLS